MANGLWLMALMLKKLSEFVGRLLWLDCLYAIIFLSLIDSYRLLAIQAGVAQLVERNLAKVEVASSRLVSRSKF